MLKGFTRNFKPLEILTEEQIEAIQRGTLDVLETTGIRVEHNRALKLFVDHGCKVDFNEKRVRIPSWLVEECLRKTPSSFTVKARDPRYDLRIGGNTLYFDHAAGMRYVDLDTWEARPGTLKEHGEAIRVLDALDTVHMLVGYEFYMEMSDIPAVMMTVEGLASGIRNSPKSELMGYTGIGDEVFAIRMAKAVEMDLLGVMCPSPPLTLYGDCCDAIFRFVEAGFPIGLWSGAAFGGTGPATIAGSTVTNNAELLAALILAQLIKPGIGVIPFDFTFPMDMKRGHPAFGALGCSLHQVMFSQVWRSYGIPTGTSQPAYPSSKKIDFQCAYEKSLLALAAALSGANVIGLHGCVHGELTFNPVQAILDDDIASWVGHFIEGVEVNDETLAIDLIEQVGPIPGHYLGEEHTRKWWKKEQFIPKVADRETYPVWIQKGKKDALALAREKMEEILTTHKISIPLTANQEEDIERILEEARRYYKKKGMIE